MNIKVIKRGQRPQQESEPEAATPRSNPSQIVERWVKDIRRKTEADRRRNARVMFPNRLPTEP